MNEYLFKDWWGDSVITGKGHHLAAMNLVDVNGHGKTFADIKSVFLDVSVGVPFLTAFEDAFGMSVSEYETQFFDLMSDYLP